jgi:PadR family transcriptional regulator
MKRIGKQPHAKYYSLTAAGRRQLKEETRGWNSMAEIITDILNTAPEEI